MRHNDNRCNNYIAKDNIRVPEGRWIQPWTSRVRGKVSQVSKLVVGASGFAPETSCAQASGAISWKSFLFNLVFENKGVRKIFGSGTVYLNVAPHAQSPSNFPLSEETAKCIRRLLAVG
jgi:hypothetical protein